MKNKKVLIADSSLTRPSQLPHDFDVKGDENHTSATYKVITDKIKDPLDIVGISPSILFEDKKYKLFCVEVPECYCRAVMG